MPPIHGLSLIRSWLTPGTVSSPGSSEMSCSTAQEDPVAEVSAAIQPRVRFRTAEAVALGIALGLVAQTLRQVPGQTMEFGAATAPWLSVGFARAVWAGRRGGAGRVLCGYLVAWLVAYHVLFAVGQSVAISAAAREALPWLVLAIPVCAALAPIAGRARVSGVIGDLSLALPLAWSVPEVFENAQRGDAAVATLIALFALSPIATSQRRDIRVRILLSGVVVLGGLAVLLGPVARGQIHS